MSEVHLRLTTFSYRFAEQVLNGRLATKQELENALRSPGLEASDISRGQFNKAFRNILVSKGWTAQPTVFDGDPGDPGARMDFLKDRIGVEIGFGHGSFLGIDVLKFQISSYSGLDKIDVGVYVAPTSALQKAIAVKGGGTWAGFLTFEKIVRYLPYFKSAIQVPIYVIGLDL